MLYFSLGFIVGGFTGIFTMCLCVASGKADKNDEE